MTRWPRRRAGIAAGWGGSSRRKCLRGGDEPRTCLPVHAGDSSTPTKRERHTSPGCLTLAADRVGGANNRSNSKQNSADSTADLTSDVIRVHLLTQCTPGLGSLLLLSSGKTTSTSVLIEVSSSYRLHSIKLLNGTQPEVKEACCLS